MNEKLKNAIKNTLGKNNIGGNSAHPTTYYNDGIEGWNLETNSYEKPEKFHNYA